MRQLSAAFLQHLKNGLMEVACINLLRIQELAPPVDAFSFDLPEEAIEGEKYPVLVVQLGMTKPHSGSMEFRFDGAADVLQE